MLVSNFPQTATYWESSGVDEYNQSIFLAPVQVRVRWQRKNELFMDNMGKQVLSQAVVYSLQTLTNQGYLAEGVLTETDPSLVESAFEIKMQAVSPSLKGSKRIYKTWL